MKIPTTLPVTAEQSRAARFQLGLTQANVIEESTLPGHKLKNFETGRFVPDMPFLESLRDYYASKGIDFTESVTVTANISTNANEQQNAAPGAAMVRPVSRMCFYVSDQLPESTVNAGLMRMDEMDERIAEIMKAPVKAGLFKKYDEQTEDNIREVFTAMAENYLAFRMLQGRNIVAPKAPGDTSEANTVADLVATFFAGSPLASLETTIKAPNNTEVALDGGE